MPSEFPFAAAGLSERDAAAFLLDRFAFGPRPGAVEEVVTMGLEAWFERQLTDEIPEPELTARLDAIGPLDLSLDELNATYLTPRETLTRMGLPRDSDIRDRALRDWGERFLRDNGLYPRSVLRNGVIARKIVRAVYAPTQLREVLTDFWFNHFNVSARGNYGPMLALDYEQRALRPHLTGSFRDLLGATARHPAMLAYLDNARSRAAEGTMTAAGRPARRGGGINENYARELMELHTLGVEGGYTQQDVIEVARAFTGWTVVAISHNERADERMERQMTQAARRGAPFIRDGHFLFRTDWHDAEAKTILGQTMPTGRGIEDGEAVLDRLAAHPSTARHIAQKLAIRFVTDDPDEALVEALATTFSAMEGNITEVLRALVRHPTFWMASDGPTKVKTPFEYVASALRVTAAEVSRPGDLYQHLRVLGEPVYYHEAPNGFPDHAAAWVNPGGVLARMRFALHLALGQLNGVDVTLRTLHEGPMPGSLEEALHLYGALLMPGRDLAGIYDQLAALVREPGLAGRVDEAARSARPDTDSGPDPYTTRLPRGAGNQLGYVAGVLLGSPQFQRQ